MISTSWYHEIRYWAQTIFLKHCQIRDTAQTIFLKHHQIRDTAQTRSLKHRRIRDTAQTIFLKHCQIRDGTQNILLKLGCEHVHPSDNVFSHYAPLRFVGKRRADETRWIRIRYSNQATSTILSLTWMCAQEINQLRQFLTTGLKKHYPRSEDWVFLRTGQQHCFRGVKNGIRQVACA